MITLFVRLPLSRSPWTKTIIAAIIFILFFTTTCSSEENAATSFPRSTPASEATSSPFPTITPIPTVIEPGLAYGQPCKPPCWRGLMPGQSTRQDVDQALEMLRTDGWASEIIGGNSDTYYISPLPRTSIGSVKIDLKDDVVEKIESNIWFDYSIATAIEQFGTPEGIRPLQEFTQCSACEEWTPSTPETGFVWKVVIYLFYPEQGLVFAGGIHPSGTGCLCPEMKIQWFCYHEPMSMAEALTDDYLANLCGVAILKGMREDELSVWHGFGGGY